MTMGSLILTIWEGSPGAGGQLEQRNDFVLFGEQNRGLRGWDVGGSGRARSELRSEVSSLDLDCGIICMENGPDTRTSASVQRGSFLEKDEACARP